MGVGFHMFSLNQFNKALVDFLKLLITFSGLKSKSYGVLLSA